MRIFTKTRSLALLATSLCATTLLMPGGASAGPAAATSPASLPAGWYIDANNLHVNNADEDDFWSDGDEPKVAVVAFRTKLGVVGSTQAWKVSDWSVICENADGGDNCAIPDGVGRAYFGNVNRPTLTQITSGTLHPELVGTIQIAVEDDNTPDSVMTGILNNLVSATRSELAAASENLTLADMADLGKVAARFNDVGTRIQNRTELQWWQKFAVWVASFGDVDDQVGYRITLMVGVDPSLRDQVNWALLGAFYKPGSKIAAAVIDPRDLTQPFSADGVEYMISESIFKA